MPVCRRNFVTVYAPDDVDYSTLAWRRFVDEGYTKILNRSRRQDVLFQPGGISGDIIGNLSSADCAPAKKDSFGRQEF